MDHLPPQICIEYSLDGQCPFATAAAFDAADWLPNHQMASSSDLFLTTIKKYFVIGFY